MSVKRENVKREIRHGTRGETAAACIGEIKPGIDIFGITKGDFSMIDILRHCAKQMGGNCDIDIGTWTAARADIETAYDLFEDGNITSMRWLVDRSFPARQPKYYQSVLHRFGRESVRLARFHAKFILLRNDTFDLAVRTSMNLNMNKRIETYEISEGSPVSGYIREIVDYHFALPNEDSYGAFTEFRVSEPAKPKEAPARLGGW